MPCHSARPRPRPRAGGRSSCQGRPIQRRGQAPPGPESVESRLRGPLQPFSLGLGPASRGLQVSPPFRFQRRPSVCPCPAHPVARLTGTPLSSLPLPVGRAAQGGGGPAPEGPCRRPSHSPPLPSPALPKGQRNCPWVLHSGPRSRFPCQDTYLTPGGGHTGTEQRSGCKRGGRSPRSQGP